MVDVATARASMVPGQQGGVRARQNPCPGSAFCLEQEELVSIDTPDVAIAPGSEGGVVTATVDLANHARFVSDFDPDLCGHGANPCSGSGTQTRGYCVTIDVSHPDGTESQTTCHRIAVLPPQRKAVDFQFPAPDVAGDEAREFSASATISLPGSEKGPSAAVEDTFTVAAGGTERPSPPSDGGGGGLPGGGGDGQGIIRQVALLAVLLIVASAAVQG